MDNLLPFIDKIKQFLPILGNFQLENFRSDHLKGGQSKGPNDFVSKIDIESEHMIKNELQKIFPLAGFFGEETGVTSMLEWMWVVDPIDGTTNYLSGVDQFSVSIALTKRGKTMLGLIYKPTSKECFWSVKDHGLFHDDKKIIPHRFSTLKNSVIGTGFPFKNYDTIDAFNCTTKQLLKNCRGIRRMGSAALDLSYTACGYFQGFWEIGLHPYDVAAGVLFLEETNCKISNFSGKPYHLFEDHSIVCGLPGVFEELLIIVKSNYIGQN